MRRMSDHRLRLMLVMSLLAFVVVVGRAVQIQGVDAAALTRKASTQQRVETALVGLRGSITSSDGQVLAQTQPSTTIVSDPKQLRNVRATAVAIARSMGVSPLELGGGASGSAGGTTRIRRVYITRLPREPPRGPPRPAGFRVECAPSSVGGGPGRVVSSSKQGVQHHG